MDIKHKIFQFTMPLVLALGIVSCDDYLNNDELDDQIYLQKSGLTETEIFNWGTFTYKLPVIKSGKGNHTTSVKLDVDETILSKYNETNNTSYKMLPADCFMLKEATLNFTKDDYRRMFLIDFNPEAITALEKDGDTYVLPCRLTQLDKNIQIADPEKAEIIIKPSVSQPYIGFETPEFYATGSEFSIKTDDDDILEIYPVVRVNYYNNWDITYKVETDKTVLDAYNKAHSTAYKLLPEAAYSIDQSSCTLRKNRDYEYLHITLKESALQLDNGNFAFGDYALPLKITEVSQYGINPKAATTIYPVSIQPPVLKVGWIVPDTLPGGKKPSNSVITDEIENISSNFTADKVIDGNPNVYWSTRAVEPTQFPYYVTISLQEKCKLYRLGFQLPNDASLGNIKAGHFEISDDAQSWTKIAEWSRPDNASERNKVINFNACEAQYIRFVITDAFQYADPAKGKTSGAVCQVGEINAWGI